MYAYIDHHMACHKYICIYDFFFSINRYFQKPKPLYVYIEVYLGCRHCIRHYYIKTFHTSKVCTLGISLSPIWFWRHRVPSFLPTFQEKELVWIRIVLRDSCIWMLVSQLKDCSRRTKRYGPASGGVSLVGGASFEFSKASAIPC